MKLIKNKRIGKVLLIVEGARHEFNLVKKIFVDILGYTQIENRRRSAKYYVREGDRHSVVAVINTKTSNILSVREEEYLDTIFENLIEHYDFDINNAAIYYLFDRDPESNTDTVFIANLIEKLKNSRENDDNMRGGMVTSFQKMMINCTIADFGDFHEMYQEVPVDALKYIEDNQHVESYYYSKPITKGDIDETAYSRYELYQHEPYNVEYYEKLDILPSDATGTYNIYVRYDNPKNFEANRETIQASLESATGKSINYRTNSPLLRYEAQVMGDVALATLYSMAIIVIIIIVVTSIFVIRNSFSISATERARQFGMLSSIGATPRQIRHSVYFEGLVIGLIGVPLGILLGIAAVGVLVIVVNVLLQGMMQADVEFCMPFWIFPVSIFLSFITIFFSSLIPAIRTARMSPIDAIRGNQDIKIKAKKLRTSKLVKNVFGIGGVIADKNLKRSRKKYRTTVVSIVLSVATFIGTS